MQGDLTALIERVEKATGPDSALDVAIACTLLDARQHKAWNAANGLRPRGAPPLPDDVFWMRHARPYTSSLDAALALVEEKMASEWPQYEVHARMIRSSREWFHFWEITVPSREFQGRSKHPAMALLQCLLRALRSQQKNSEVKDAG